MQKSIIVELDQFRMRVFEYDEVIRTITRLSIGLQAHRTPIIQEGSLHPTKRIKNHISSSWPKPNGGAKMPFALFFAEEPSCAFHEGSSAVPSHGCIHLEVPDAQWLFEWAGSSLVGLKILGPYPSSSVPPQKFYAMGASNMLTSVVKAIQQALIDAGYEPGDVDGDFGDRTDAAVRKFQEDRGLVVDATVGRDTAAALGVAW